MRKTAKKEVKMIVPTVQLYKIRRLSEISVTVLICLASCLGDGEGRVAYGDIAKSIGVPRSSVKYAMDQLIGDGIVKVIDGERLTVRESVIWVDVE